jgi:GntR family transcriptional regulator, arabinose operon transcriptional repressor
MATEATDLPKHRRISQAVRRQIESGVLNPGDRIPSDVDLVREFGVSRPTVAKALQELERCGLVKRQPGSGTYVLEVKPSGQNFGLLISNLGAAEIFEPICGEMARVAQRKGHSLMWGGGASPNQKSGQGDEGAAIWQLCQQFIRAKVGGVFFAPLELTADKDQVNNRIAEALHKAKIPVVLLDRDYVAPPDRSKHDLIGIDNRRAGHMIANHLLDQDCKRLMFVGRVSAAPTVDMRIAGFQDAVFQRGLPLNDGLVRRGDPRDSQFVKEFLRKFRPDGIVCANDLTAGHLLHTLQELAVRVPDDVLVAGIDDVRYAELFRVRLTTVRQPCPAIGNEAFQAMMERIENPDAPVRDILLACELIVRDSTKRPAV